MPMMWGYAYGWPMMFWMGFGEVIWLLLLGAILWLLFMRRQNHQTSTTEPSAMEILRRRYARGEIDLATFEQMQKHLENDHYQSEHWPIGTHAE